MIRLRGGSVWALTVALRARGVRFEDRSDQMGREGANEREGGEA